MRRITAIIVVAMVTVLTGAAQATTLTVTSGYVSVGEVPAAFYDPTIRLQGDNWSLSSGGPYPFSASATGGIVPLYDPGFVVDGLNLSMCCTLSNLHGTISLFHDPAPLPLSTFIELVETAFTMTGHVDLGGGFDLVGQGTLVAGPSRTEPHFVQRVYTFTAPDTIAVAEPPTLLFVVASLGPLGALFSARFLRDRRHRSRLP